MIINLTPHAVRVILPEPAHLTQEEADAASVGGIVEFPPSGTVARVETVSRPAGAIVGYGVTIPVTETAYGAVTGLPLPQAGAYYLVSAVVAAAAPERADLLVPADLVRDAAGNVTACRGFSRPQAQPAGQDRCLRCGDRRDTSPDGLRWGLGVGDSGVAGGLGACGDAHVWGFSG